MNYEYDIFVSYRRGQWDNWVSRIFLPILVHWVGTELGRDVSIFLDVQIETGTVWPAILTKTLAKSCVLVPLLSRTYFHSRWCQIELAYMIAREAKYGHSGLIIPAIIHGGDDFPYVMKKMQCLNLQDVASPFISYGSRTHEKLSEKIRVWAPYVANAIMQVPPYDPAWRQLAIDEFIEQLNIPSSKQITLPYFSD